MGGAAASGVWSPLILSLVSAVSWPFITAQSSLLYSALGTLSVSLCPMLMHLPQPTLHLVDSPSKSNPDKNLGAIKRETVGSKYPDCLAECVGGEEEERATVFSK